MRRNGSATGAVAGNGDSRANIEASRSLTAPDSPGGGGGTSLGFSLFSPPKANVPVDEHISMTYSAVWGSVRIIAGTMMSLPIIERKVLTSGEVRVVRDSPIMRLLSGGMANDEQTSAAFIEAMQVSALLWGNGYAEIERARNGEVVALWPIDPSRVQVDRESDGSLVYVVSNSGASRAVLRPSEVFHLRGLSGDGIVGYSVIRMARESVALGIAAEYFGASFFGNSARPSGILTHPGELGDEGIDRLRRTWEAAHRGTSKTGSVAVLQEDIKWTSLTIPPDDAQFLQTREFQVRDIGPRWFGVPSFMLGDSTGASFGNMEQMWIMFATTTIQQWASRWESELPAKIYGPERGRRRFVRFDLRELMRGDQNTRASFYKSMFSIGVLSPNDARIMEGLQPVEGGDVRLVPMNMVPLEDVRDFAGSKSKIPPPPQRGAPPGEGDNEGNNTEE